MQLSLGIDIGTTGVRTATIDSREQVFSISKIKHIPQNSIKINPKKYRHILLFSSNKSKVRAI